MPGAIDDDHHQVGRAGHRLGHRRLPARQRDPVQRMVRARRRDHGRGPRPVHPRGDPASRGPRVQRRCGHQGNAEDRGLHRADRRQPRLLRGVPRGVRVRGARRGRGQRVLCGRRHRPGRQCRRDRRLRRRDVRPARGGARRSRRGHPPVTSGAAAHDATAVLHRRHRRCRDPAPLRVGARGGATRRPRRGRPAGRARYRAQGHPGDPRGQGGAEPDRRAEGQRQLPDGARALRSSSTCPGCPTSTAMRSPGPSKKDKA